MKIVLSGVETNNKGAELMLYAILQEIERKFPDAEVYIPYNRIKQGINYVKTDITLKYTPLSNFVTKTKLRLFFRGLHLPMDIIDRTNIVRGADWFIDGSGFLFSDKFQIKEVRVCMWRNMLRTLHRDRCKIIFLPQAFGPAENKETKEILSVLSEYSSVIMPRERVSYSVLLESGVVDMGKVQQFTDFTSLVEGEFPCRYEKLRNGVCIIPNRQMINKGTISVQEYQFLLEKIINTVTNQGRKVYLLNHEGRGDELLCFKIKERMSGRIEVVTGLNALEVKGLIASAYMVVTSRFHGLASALNSCVPALATSWSHKYEELYHDYGISDGVLPIHNIDDSMAKIREYMAENRNNEIRKHLSEIVPQIKEQTREMWKRVWSI